MSLDKLTLRKIEQYLEHARQRHAGDYDLLSPDQATAERSLGHAERFVQRIEQALRDMKAIL